MKHLMIAIGTLTVALGLLTAGVVATSYVPDYVADGDVLSEDGRVVGRAFVPAGHGSGTGWAFTKNGGPVDVDVHIPERYAIVFACAHGSFVVEGESAKALYYRLEEGQPVVIRFRQVYKVTKPFFGKTTREPYDFDFLDAIPRFP